MYSVMVTGASAEPRELPSVGTSSTTGTIVGVGTGVGVTVGATCVSRLATRVDRAATSPRRSSTAAEDTAGAAASAQPVRPMRSASIAMAERRQPSKLSIDSSFRYRKRNATRPDATV